MQDTPVTDAASEPGFDLDAAEIRVLGVLIEKSFITPDAYPLSINAITTGCNQLTAREPVMSLSESEVQAAIDSLMGRRLVSKRDQQSARVPKYEHLVRLRHSLPPAEQAVLAILLLRGAQTAGELRQAHLNRMLDPEIETVLLPVAPQYMHVSSTAVREISGFGGDVASLLPASIVQTITARLAALRQG